MVQSCGLSQQTNSLTERRKAITVTSLFLKSVLDTLREQHPEAILEVASNIVADEGELTPAMRERLRRVQVELKRRHDRAQVVNG